MTRSRLIGALLCTCILLALTAGDSRSQQRAPSAAGVAFCAAAAPKTRPVPRTRPAASAILLICLTAMLLSPRYMIAYLCYVPSPGAVSWSELTGNQPLEQPVLPSVNRQPAFRHAEAGADLVIDVDLCGLPRRPPCREERQAAIGHIEM